MELAPLKVTVDTFKDNAESVHRLTTFDQTVLDVSMSGMKSIRDFLQRQKLDVPLGLANKYLKILENLRENGSTAVLYQEVYNQCLVLLVSHFESAARDLYRSTVRHAISGGTAKGLEKLAVEVPLSELSGPDPKERIVDLYLEKAGLSFQDLGGTARAFRPFTESWQAERDCTNDVILAQAARHAIIHRAAKVDQKMMDQISNASPRTLKSAIRVGDKLTFTPAEIQTAGRQMESYLRTLCAAVERGLEPPPF